MLDAMAFAEACKAHDGALCKEAVRQGFQDRTGEWERQPPWTEIIAGRLFLGNYEAAEDREGCAERKVTSILTTANNLTELDPAPGVRRQVLLVDDEEEDISTFFDEALAFIRGGISLGATLVHCAGGQNRSATIVEARDQSTGFQL